MSLRFRTSGFEIFGYESTVTRWCPSDVGLIEAGYLQFGEKAVDHVDDLSFLQVSKLAGSITRNEYGQL